LYDIKVLFTFSYTKALTEHEKMIFEFTRLSATVQT